MLNDTPATPIFFPFPPEWISKIDEGVDCMASMCMALGRFGAGLGHARRMMQLCLQTYLLNHLSLLPT